MGGWVGWTDGAQPVVLKDSMGVLVLALLALWAWAFGRPVAESSPVNKAGASTGASGLPPGPRPARTRASKAGAERLRHSSVQLFNGTYSHMLAEIDADAAATLVGAIKRRPAAI